MSQCTSYNILYFGFMPILTVTTWKRGQWFHFLHRNYKNWDHSCQISHPSISPSGMVSRWCNRTTIAGKTHSFHGQRSVTLLHSQSASVIYTGTVLGRKWYRLFFFSSLKSKNKLSAQQLYGLVERNYILRAFIISLNKIKKILMHFQKKHNFKFSFYHHGDQIIQFIIKEVVPMCVSPLLFLLSPPASLKSLTIRVCLPCLVCQEFSWTTMRRKGKKGS